MFGFVTRGSPYQPPECHWEVSVTFNGTTFARQTDFSSREQAADYGFCLILHLMAQGYAFINGTHHYQQY